MTTKIFKNQYFKNYEHASTVLEKYFTEQSQVFSVSDSLKIKQENYKKPINLDVQYSRLIYSCRFGKEEKRKGNGLRKTR